MLGNYVSTWRVWSGERRNRLSSDNYSPPILFAGRDLDEPIIFSILGGEVALFTHGSPTPSHDNEDAVGVFENQEVRIVIKDLKRSSSCASGYDMQWNEEITTGSSSFNVTNWEARIYTRQQALNKNVNGTAQISKSNAEEFKDFFGLSDIPPRTTVTASVCWSSRGTSRIWLHSEITGAHGDGAQATHYAGRYYLR